MKTYHICTAPDEKNERLLLSGKIPNDWKTPEEVQKENWIHLRLQQAKEKLKLSPNNTTHKVYLQAALSDLKRLTQQQYARFSYENDFKLMVAAANSDVKRLGRLYAIQAFLDKHQHIPTKIIAHFNYKAQQNERIY
jgi:hypothetical protein